MDGAVGELGVMGDVPQIEVCPAVSVGGGLHQGELLIICPTRIVKGVENIAVLALSDKHWLIDENDGDITCALNASSENIEGEIGFGEWVGETVEIGARFKVFGAKLVGFGV